MKTMQMLADPLLKQGGVVGVGKYRLGKGVPDSGNGWDKGFTMPGYALTRQPHTKIVRGSCLTCITGSGKGRGDDGP